MDMINALCRALTSLEKKLAKRNGGANF